MSKPTVIIQARMGSTRLPCKVLMPLPYVSGIACGDNVLYQVCKRALAIHGIDQLIIATTTQAKDNVIEKWAEKNAILSYRGSEDDVLDRFYQAALLYEADPIIRITGDCPCIDPEIISAMLERYYKSNADYLSNTLNRTFPHGLDAEIFSFAALKKAHREVSDNYSREHVTPYLYQSGLFQCVGYEDPNALDVNPHIRVTLDTPEDSIVIYALYDLLGTDFSYQNILDAFAKYPWLRLINQNIRQKKQYQNEESEIADAVALLKFNGFSKAAKRLANL